jgi:hypothetical protein
MSTAVILPTDCWTRMFGYLNLTALGNVALVCKDFAQIQFETQSLWERFVPSTFETKLTTTRERVRLFSQLFIRLGSAEMANACILDLYHYTIKQVKDAKVEALCELAMNHARVPNGSFVLYISKSQQECVVIKDKKGTVHHIVEKAKWGDEPAILDLRFSVCLPGSSYFEYHAIQLVYSQENVARDQLISHLSEKLRGALDY